MLALNKLKKNISNSIAGIIQSTKIDVAIGHGNYALDVGRYDKAREHYENALKIALEIGNKRRQEDCYCNLGLVFHNLADYSKAKEYHEKALKIALEIGDKAGEKSCHGNLGSACKNLGDYSGAKEHHQKALKIALETGDKAGERKCNTNLGHVLYYLADYNQAKECYKKALKIAIKIRDKAGEGDSYTNLGVICDIVADYSKAEEYHEKALKIALETGDKAEQGISYANLGFVFYNISDYHKSKEYFEKALKIDLETNNKQGEEVNYTGLGLAFHGLYDYHKSKEYFEKALKIALETGDKAGQGISYGNLGRAFDSLGDYSKAKEYHEKALKVELEIGYKAGEERSYNNLGLTLHSLGDYSGAKEYYRKALKVAVEIGDINGKRTILLNQGDLHISTNELHLAHRFIKESIDLGEIIGGKLIEEEHKIGFYGQGSNAYELIVPVCVSLNKNEEAFEFAERSKSKAFIDLLTTSSITPFLSLLNKGKEEELRVLLEEEEQIVRKLQLMQRNTIRDLGNASHVSSSGDRALALDSILKERDAIYSRMEPLVPEYVSLRRAKTIALNKLQNLLSEDDGIVLVEYFLTQDKIFIFVLRNKDLNIHTIDLSEKRINEYLNNYEEEVMNYPNLMKSAKSVTNKWLEISKYLIDPISEYLTNSKLVYFVPHGILHYLPLHALLLNNEPLVKTHPVAYSSSSSLLPFYKNKGTHSLKSCAVFGFEFFDEAQEVAKIYKVNPKLDVTTSEILKNLGHDILHFSCHGYFDNKDPLSSGIVLKDNVLRAKKIFDLNLNSELVTLSACETGISEYKPGDELIGLTRAFIYAGVPSLVVSLWDVSAYTTKELMIEFYANLKKGYQKAIALQKAQVELMKKYEHPFFWAPFILIGDWD